MTPGSPNPAMGVTAPARCPLVYVVILNWNKSADTLACLDSVRGQYYENCRVVVVDNGSTVEAVRALETAPRTFILIRNGRNVGFTGGVNIGIRYAIAEGADYVWLLNNDARADPSALGLMVAAAEADTRIGLVSPVVRNSDSGGVIDFAGGTFDPYKMIFEMTNKIDVYADWVKRNPDRIWVTGTALLIRAKLAAEIGLFDDRFFAYYEDNDYSVRSAKAGYLNVVVPEAQILHESGPPGRATPVKQPYFYYYMARNLILLRRKHCGALWDARSWMWMLADQLKQVRSLRGNPRYQSAIRAGIADGFLGRFGEFTGASWLRAAAGAAILTAANIPYQLLRLRR